MTTVRGLPSNMPIKLSVRPVTPLAEGASVAPVRPTAYRRRCADKTMSQRLTMLCAAALAKSLASSCIRNLAAEQPEGDCEVHHVRLATSIVPLDYGLPIPAGRSYAAAYKAEFPHALRAVNGGCVVNRFYKWARVRSCPQCNRAEEDWVKQHADDFYEHDRALPTAKNDANAARSTLVMGRTTSGSTRRPRASRPLQGKGRATRAAG